MNRRYSDYIDIMNEVAKVEQVIITDNKMKNHMLLLYNGIN